MGELVLSSCTGTNRKEPVNSSAWIDESIRFEWASERVSEMPMPTSNLVKPRDTFSSLFLLCFFQFFLLFGFLLIFLFSLAKWPANLSYLRSTVGDHPTLGLVIRSPKFRFHGNPWSKSVSKTTFLLPKSSRHWGLDGKSLWQMPQKFGKKTIASINSMWISLMVIFKHHVPKPSCIPKQTKWTIQLWLVLTPHILAYIGFVWKQGAQTNPIE